MTEESNVTLPARRSFKKAALPIIIMCTICVVVSSVFAAKPATSQQDFVIDSFRPLQELAFLLEETLGVPVTVEEPVWPGNGMGQAPGSFYLLDTRFRFVLPAYFLPEDKTSFNLSTLNGILALYNRDPFDPVKFEALSSEWGYHIVPVAFTVEKSVTIAVLSPLDVPVNVETKRRLASEHFKALCEAIGASAGREIQPFAPHMDGWFAAGGLAPPKHAASLLSEKDREPYTFAWGVKSATGRIALLDLLKSSSTTLTWALYCRDRGGKLGHCVLNMSPLKVRERDEQGRPVLDENGKPRLKVQYLDWLSKVPLKRPPIRIQ